MNAFIVRWLVARLVRLFYPQIEVRGRANVPAGPILFVLNHPNSLLDPLILINGIDRHVAFLAKSTFFANPIGRWMMQSFGALPVYRQHDQDRPGAAQPDLSDRNEATFARCRAQLRAGQSLALFPEGTTHSSSMLLPLRTGAARIALGAEAEANWRLGLHIVPVGLWYEQKSRFRSSVLVVIGEAFDLADFAPAKAGDRHQHDMVRELTNRIEHHLAAVVLQAEHAEVLQRMSLVAAWTAPYVLQSLAQQYQRTADLLAAYTRLQCTHPEQLAAVVQQLHRYARVLHSLGIDDPWQLELSKLRPGRMVWLVCWLIVGFVPALAGLVLSYGPYRLAAPLTPYFMGEYEELLSTGKLIIGSVLVVLGWLLAALLCGLLCGVLCSILLLLCAPALAYCALRWGETWHELREVIGYTWLGLRHQSLVQTLVARRQALVAQVAQLVQLAEKE